MKKIFSNIRTMAALLMAGAAFAACSSSDDIIENQQPANNGKQAYTLTVSASKDGSTTRALGLDGSAVVASWETTDVIHVTQADGTEIGTLSPTDISGLTATFTGTISGDAQINELDVLTLTYHPVADFATQNGTLSDSENSAENYDMAVATVTISEINGKNIIVSESSANFVNQTAVVVLSPYNSSWSQYHSINSLTVSVTMDISEVGTVTEKIGPITVTGDQPHYFSLPSQSLLAEVLAAKYSLSASAVSTLLASATVTFTGHQTGDSWDREYLTCSKTGYKFAAGKYYKLDNSNFSMTFLYKRAAADKDVYVENQDVSWEHTVTFAVNREIGWRIVGDDVYCGDKQLYVEVGPGPLGPDPYEGFVKATDDHIPFGATYSLVTPAPSYDNTLNINTYNPELNNWEDVTVPTGKHWLITGTGEATTNTIIIANNATVTLSGVNITAFGRSITCVGNATIILADGTTNNLYAADEFGAAGIEMSGGSGTSLTIQGNTGVLNITSGRGPAIGAGYEHAGCAINIEGGIINATSTDGPGIGAAYSTACGNITISGGTVAATGGYGCPGIGGASSANCGDITITSGVTSVTATKGSEAPYSIGASSSGSCGTVTIEDPSKVTQN